MVPAGSDAWRESIVQPISLRGDAAVSASSVNVVRRRRRTERRARVAGRARRRRPGDRRSDRRRRRDAADRPYELLGVRREDRAARGIAVRSSSVDRHRADRGRRRRDRPSDAGSAAPGTCRPRSSSRISTTHRPGRVAGRTLHRVRLVAVREDGLRAPRRRDAAARDVGLADHARCRDCRYHFHHDRDTVLDRPVSADLGGAGRLRVRAR